MTRTNDAFDILAALAGAAAGIAVAATPAEAQADNSGRTATRRQLMERVMWNMPSGNTSGEGTNYALASDSPNYNAQFVRAICGSENLCGLVDHIHKQLRQLKKHNVVYVPGALINVKEDGSIDEEHSGIFLGVRGVRKGLARDVRRFEVTLDNGSVANYHPDVNDKIQYYFVEYASIANDLDLDNDQIVRLIAANQHKGERAPDINRMMVLRYRSDQEGTTLNLSTKPNGGDLVFDILTTQTGLSHLARGSQYVRMPNGELAKHPMIEPLDSLIKEPNSGLGLVYISLDLITKSYVNPRASQKIARQEPPQTEQPDVEPEDEGEGDNPTPVPPPVPPPIPPKADGKNPNIVLGANFLYLENNFLPEAVKMAQLEIGGRVSRNLYLIGSLGFGYAGSETTVDPRTRKTLPNPLDPFALGSDVRAEDSRKAYVLSAGLGVSGRVASWFQIGGGLVVYVPIQSKDHVVSENLTYPNGTVASENHYGNSSTDVTALVGPNLNLEFRVHDNVGIVLHGAAAFGADGKKMYGGGGGLRFYFGDDGKKK